MTYLADLSRCTYLDRDGTRGLVSVGWLSRTQPVTAGPVSADIRARLATLLKFPYCPVTFLGSHLCEFCAPAIVHPHDLRYPHGSRNLLVPGDRAIFACPELIAHYIDEHGYQPPSVFLAAVSACPPTDSEAYYLRLLEAGGASWIEPLRAEIDLFSEGRIDSSESDEDQEWLDRMRRRTGHMRGALRSLGLV